jgi:predicted dehydrogenase
MIGVGVIGCGQISDLHLSAYTGRDDARIEALVDVDPVAATRQRDRFGLEAAAIFTDYRAALDDPRVDLVEILVPHHLHRDVALAALRAGKHVSLQKPMGISIQEADELVVAASASHAASRVFENFVFYPPVVKAKQIIDSGDLGDILAIRIKSNAGYNENAWPPPAEAWRYDRDKCGGGPMIFDDGHHKFALACYLGGLPESVFAWIGSTTLTPDLTLDVPSLVSWRYRSGALGSFEATYSPELFVDTHQYPQDDRIEVTGSRGVLWVTRGHGQLIDGEPPLIVRIDRTTTAYHDIPSDWASSFSAATAHFLDAIGGKHPPQLSFADARDVLRFGIAAESSARSGEPVEFPAPEPAMT